MRQLHLVRHGQSTWNALGLVQGQSDEPELTDFGRRQAQWVADALRGRPIDRLLTSDQRRAADTAAILEPAIDVRPIATSLLREQSCGIAEGRSTGVAAAQWEQAAAAVDDYGDPLPLADVRLPGGESMRDVLARVAALLAAPWVTEATGDVVLVSHGDTIRMMLAHLLGDDPDAPQWREVGNGDIHSIRRGQDDQVVHDVTRPAVPEPP